MGQDFLDRQYHRTMCPRSLEPFYIIANYIMGQGFLDRQNHCTMCPRSLEPFYIVSSYIKWVKTSWAYSTKIKVESGHLFC